MQSEHKKASYEISSDKQGPYGDKKNVKQDSPESENQIIVDHKNI